MFENLCKCEVCPLRESKQKLGTVSGELVGLDSTDKEVLPLMVVGMSPVKEELKRKTPMTGPSGQLSRSVTEKSGFNNYYITNTLNCYYPEEASRTQLKEAAECCRPRLLAEIEYFQPTIIMPLGAFPTQQFLAGEVPVSSVEGRVIRTNKKLLPLMEQRLVPESSNSIPFPHGPIGDLSDQSPNSVIIPSAQPAYILRNPEMFPDLQHNFDVGTRYAQGIYKAASNPATVIVSEDNIASVLDTLFQYDELVIDLETTKDGFFPYGLDPDKIRCIAIAGDEKTGYIIPYSLIHHKGVHELIDTKPGVYHNGHFDCGFLFQEGFRPIISYDTMLAHFLIDERLFAHGLKVLAGKYLGAPDWEEDLQVYLPSKKSSYDNIPDEVLYPYAARDVCYTYQLKQIFQEMVSEKGNGTFANLLMPLTNMFNAVRHRGIKLDIDLLVDLDDQFRTEAEKLTEELVKEVGWDINPNSPRDVKKYLYEDLELPESKQYGYSTNKKWLSHFLDVEGVRLIIEAREFKKLSSTYVTGMTKFIDSRARVHPYTKLYGTVTGRIATSDPSIMNISKRGGIKNMYVPSDPNGHILDVDFSGMELRCYGVLSNDTYLQELLWEGADPHSIVAAEASERAGREILRGPAKAAVFGKMYGRGLESFKTGLRLDEQSALELISTIENFFPSLNQYHDQVRSDIHKRGELVSYFGRRRRFPLLTRDNISEVYRQGGNFGIQSMASDVNLYCMLHMFQFIEETGAVPLFPVHDSIVFDVKEGGLDNVEFIKNEMRKHAEDMTGGLVPFKVEAQAGKTWGKMDIEV